MKAKGLVFNFKNNFVFENLSFDFDKNKNYCLIGNNGEGKTTFLKLLMGQLKPSSGSISLNANSFSYLPASTFIHSKLNLSEAIEIYGLSKKYFYKSEISHALRINELPVHAILNQISSGERQRFLLALSLLKPADLLVLDEPISFLDFKTRSTLSRLLKTLNRPYILSSHDFQFCLDLNNTNVLLLNQSKVLDLGLPKEALTSEIFQKTFQFKSIVTDNPIDGSKLLVLAKSYD